MFILQTFFLLMNKTLTYLQLALGMSIYGSGTPVSKLVTEAFPVYLGSGLRMLFAALVLLPFIIRYKDDIKKFTKKDFVMIGIMGFSAMFLFTILMMYGMKMISGVIGSIIMGTSPAVTAIGSVLFLKETMSGRKWMAIGLAVLGIIIVNFGGGMNMDMHMSAGSMTIGMILIFLAVCAGGAYTILSKKIIGQVKPMLIVSLSVMIALVLFIPFAVSDLSSFDLSGVTTSQWLALIWWGAGSVSLGLSLWNFGIEKSSGVTAAGFMGFMSISSLILSYILLGEQFYWHQLAGFVVVFISLILLTWSPKGQAAMKM